MLDAVTEMLVPSMLNTFRDAELGVAVTTMICRFVGLRSMTCMVDERLDNPLLIISAMCSVGGRFTSPSITEDSAFSCTSP